MPPIIPITLPKLLKLIGKGYPIIVTVPKNCKAHFPFGTSKGFPNRFKDNEKLGSLDSIDEYMADYMSYQDYRFYTIIQKPISYKE